MKVFHNLIGINYWWAGEENISTDLKIDLEEHSLERITDMLKTGYTEGELLFETASGESFRGYWKFNIRTILTS